MNYRILLYYKYVSIEDHEVFAKAHLEYCSRLGVKGRIVIAPEGINGTLSGTLEQTDAYIDRMHRDSRFADMAFKIDPFDRHAFPRLTVKARNEIVTMQLSDDVDPNHLTGRRLEPKDFYRALQEDDVLVIDGRNDYEFEMGHFRNALRPQVKAFKDFPDWIRGNLSDYKDKKILTYCTGGIRCEKLSGFLLKEGFQNVFQLHGGIDAYRKDPEVGGRLFDGRCFVFDDRISIPVNQSEEDIVITYCHYCGKPSDHFVNCANLDCHMSFYACPECERLHKRSCSAACEAVEHHEYVARGENLFDSVLTPKGLFKSYLNEKKPA